MVKGQAQIMETIGLYINKLKKDIRVTRVILFGSYARGNARPYSDIDLVVFSPDFDAENPMKDLQFLAHAARGIDVSIEALAHRPEDFEHYEKGSFLHDIIQNGRVVYEG